MLNDWRFCLFGSCSFMFIGIVTGSFYPLLYSTLFYCLACKHFKGLMPYTPRHIRQFNERQEWVNDLTFYLLEERYYKQGEEDKAEFAAERILCNNLDEGGDLMEEDAVKFFKEHVREILEED